MASIGWLHLTDLHQGKLGANYLFPVVRREFFRDLEGLDRSAKPWDLLLFIGDLTQRGSAAEFAALGQTLGGLRDHLAELGSHPLLLAVPGKHDPGPPPGPGPRDHGPPPRLARGPAAP